MIAEVEPTPLRKALFAALAEEADSQASIWAEQARAAGKKIDPSFRPNARVRFVAQLVRRLGVRPVRTVLAAMKVRGMAVYDGGGRVHPARTEQGHPMPTTLSEVGRRHHTRDGATSLRAAVFGVNDGLVSNASLILGITGASASTRTIVVSGTAGLLAGATARVPATVRDINVARRRRFRRPRPRPASCGSIRW